MSEVIEHSQERLDNIQAIEPILSALRTISMGSWQKALKLRANLQEYRSQFGDIYQFVLPYINKNTSVDKYIKPKTNNKVALVIGSERGLIGKFNRDLVEFTKNYIKEQERDGTQVKFWLLGSRIKRLFIQREIHFDQAEALSTTSLPIFDIAAKMIRKWLISYEKCQIDAIDVIYNAYNGHAKYKIQVDRLLPFSYQKMTDTKPTSSWPQPIIETDPRRLYAQLIKQETTIHLFELLLESAASEHSARYQLMEEAVQNSDRLIEELNNDLQTIRHQAITREMQELAAGAGLLE